MRYLLDTNVLSEGTRPSPDDNLARWMKAQPMLDLAISPLTLGEIRQGVLRLGPGRRRERLEEWLSIDLPRQFLGRILPVDEAVALAWGELSAAGRAAGRPLPVVDGLLLATAAAHGLTMVTRNESDCGERGVPLLNPWNGNGF